LKQGGFETRPYILPLHFGDIVKFYIYKTKKNPPSICGKNYILTDLFRKRSVLVIVLRKLNGQEFILNADLIEAVEANPDTKIKLYTGNFYVVKNSVDEVVQMAVEYRKNCGGTLRVVNKKSEEEQ